MRKKAGFAALVIAVVMSSCFTQEHIVGKGASGSDATSKKQWFILWGLVPLNNVDSKALASGATNYTIKTEESFVDGIIGMFTGILTIAPRTVTVTK